MRRLAAIDLGDVLLCAGGLLVSSGVYLNWGLGWAMLIFGLLVLALALLVELR